MQYFAPVSERIPLLQFVPSGEQNHPLAIQLIPLVTLWPLLAQVQHTVSTSIMSSLLGTNMRPCPTVTSHPRGPGPSQGVRSGRGVGVGLAVTRSESTKATLVTTAAMNIKRTTRGVRGIEAACHKPRQNGNSFSGKNRCQVRSHLLYVIKGSEGFAAEFVRYSWRAYPSPRRKRHLRSRKLTRLWARYRRRARSRRRMGSRCRCRPGCWRWRYNCS